MAFVGVTNQLIYDVSQRIEQMKRSETALLKIPTTYNITGTEPWFVEAVWGEHAHLADQIPQKWKRAIEAADIHFPPVPLSDGRAQPLRYRVQCSNGSVYGPPNCGSYPDVKLAVVPPDLAELHNKLREHAEIEHKWSGINMSVTKFLNECRSLNEALKIMPKLQAYIPQSYLTKLETKRSVTRSKTSAIEAAKNVDEEKIAAAAVLARMVGGVTA